MKSTGLKSDPNHAENLMVMGLPVMFLDVKGDPTNKVRLSDVTIPNATKHLIKLYMMNNAGVWVYPFASHARVAGRGGRA